MVMAQMGFYAALIWFPFPIGALSYLKAWLCPAVAKQESPDP